MWQVNGTISFAGLVVGERLHGLGEHRDGQVAHSSFSSDWAMNNNGVLTIAMTVSDRGWGFLWNNAGYGRVVLNNISQKWTADATANIDFWIATSSANSSNRMADVLLRYADAVGHSVPMPYAASGFWMSKNRYRNQTQLLDVARGKLQPPFLMNNFHYQWVLYRA